ncbi:MAG: spermidine synthase [Deltaproteobacteria bacterium]
MKPWKTLGSVATAEGALELRQRGDQEFLLVIGGRVLMTSQERRSEERLATIALAQVKVAAPRVLIGGLGMAYTLRAALDVLPAAAQVEVAELSPAVAEWCRGPLAVLTNDAAGDPRVRVILGDVSRVIRDAAPGSYDAILLDLYEGPHAASQRGDDPFYGPGALARSHAALAPGGVLAVWSEDPDDSFLRRFRNAGFEVNVDRSGSSRVHLVYLGVRR